jgi:hypothetical protein
MIDGNGGSETVFRRLCFLEGEWRGEISNRDSRSRYEDRLVCSIDDDGRISCKSRMFHNGEEIGSRAFEIWIEGDNVCGRWELDGERTGKYICEYEEERDEFLFNLLEMPTSLDYRTIRRIDMMHFITMEQIPKEGTSAVETLQVKYIRTL